MSREDDGPGEAVVVMAVVHQVVVVLVGKVVGEKLGGCAWGMWVDGWGTTG